MSEERERIMKEKQSLITKAKDGLSTLKSHWKTPPQGYYVNYKEFLCMAMGSGSLSALGVILQWTTIAINIPMMISYFKVSSGFVFIFGIIGSLVGLLRAPILSMIIDNFNSKKGKFKPFLPWTAAVTVICFTVIPFIPLAWTENILFSFNIPSIPLFGVAASTVEMSLAGIALIIVNQIGAFFHTLLCQCLAGIEQTISPVLEKYCSCRYADRALWRSFIHSA